MVKKESRQKKDQLDAEFSWTYDLWLEDRDKGEI